MKIPGMPTCKEVFEHRYDMNELGFTKKMMIMMHMTICKNCQHFQATMHSLEHKMKDTMKKNTSSADQSEIDSLKKRIKEQIKN